jgi:tetratricopeptide (TPR) repeat protein
MPKSKFIVVIVLLFVFLTNHSLVSNAATFSDKITEIRKEINRDNLKDAIKLLQKVKISSENEQEQIDLLFGDIYLKINKPSKAEEFYEKSFMTSDVRSGELIAYLKTNVSKEAFKQAREQDPTLVGNHNQVLARYR